MKLIGRARDVQIVIRVTAEERREIEQAAIAAKARSISDFVRDRVIPKAEETKLLGVDRG